MNLHWSMMTLSIPSLSWLVVRRRLMAPLSILSCWDSRLFSRAISFLSSSSWFGGYQERKDLVCRCLTGEPGCTMCAVHVFTCWLLQLSLAVFPMGKDTLHTSLSSRPASSSTWCMVLMLQDKLFRCCCSITYKDVDRLTSHFYFLEGSVDLNLTTSSPPCCHSPAVEACADTPAVACPYCVTASVPLRFACGVRCSLQSSPKCGARCGSPTSGDPAPAERERRKRCPQSCCWASHRPPLREIDISHLKRSNTADPGEFKCHQSVFAVIEICDLASGPALKSFSYRGGCWCVLCESEMSDG